MPAPRSSTRVITAASTIRSSLRDDRAHSLPRHAPPLCRRCETWTTPLTTSAYPPCGEAATAGEVRRLGCCGPEGRHARGSCVIAWQGNGRGRRKGNACMHFQLPKSFPVPSSPDSPPPPRCSGVETRSLSCSARGALEVCGCSAAGMRVAVHAGGGLSMDRETVVA
eukprot:354050-Chlamydomonas_euryale.AAC.3